jgi:hypothetical protein
MMFDSISLKAIKTTKNGLQRSGEESMPTTIRSVAIIQIWILFAAIITSAPLIDVAHALSAQNNTRAALTCGKELKNRCNGVPVQANNMLECLQKEQEKNSKGCAALADNVVHMCERDAVQLCQGVVAGSGNIFGCLTAARRWVSKRCNAALDAAFLRP